MSSRYIPAGDSQFDDWVRQFSTYAQGHADDLGLTAEDVAALNAKNIQWATDFAAANTAHVSYRASVATKNDTRVEFEELIRPMVARIQVNPTTTDADRQELGITVRGTGTSDMELPQEERPTAHIDITAPLEHVVLIRTKTPTGEKRGKPAGAIGCEIYRKVGTTPAGPSEMEFVMLATQSRVKLGYAEADGGKKAHYMMRYVTRTGEKGPWSEVESATIAA